jgi:hypothetical protein
MRRIAVIIFVVLLAVFSVAATFYVSYLQDRRKRPVPLAADSEVPEVVSPADLLQPPSEVADAGTSPAAAASMPVAREVIVYPDWKPGSDSVKEARPVSDNGGYVRPLWSPVGLDIVFTRADGRGLYVTAPNKPDVRVLSSDPGVGRAPRWNIDGMSLHVREPDGQFSNIMITGEKYPAPPIFEKVFERDGVIYFQPDVDQPPRRVSGSQDRFRSPVLSPDETRVAYIGLQTGIYLSPVDGSEAISVGRGFNPSWLPDSSGIVYDIPTGDANAVVDADLWYASADGTERTNLTNTPGVMEVEPHVSQDGERIAFSSGGTIYVGRFDRPARAVAPPR